MLIQHFVEVSFTYRQDLINLHICLWLVAHLDDIQFHASCIGASPALRIQLLQWSLQLMCLHHEQGSSKPCLWHNPKEKKSRVVVTCGERGSQDVGPFLPIHLLGEVLSKNWRTNNPHYGVAPSCSKTGQYLYLVKILQLGCSIQLLHVKIHICCDGRFREKRSNGLVEH